MFHLTCSFNKQILSISYQPPPLLPNHFNNLLLMRYDRYLVCIPYRYSFRRLNLIFDDYVEYRALNIAESLLIQSFFFFVVALVGCLKCYRHIIEFVFKYAQFIHASHHYSELCRYMYTFFAPTVSPSTISTQ